MTDRRAERHVSGRRLALAASVAVAVAVPGIARAASSKLPQMDFANPLTLTQVGWMLVIMAALYAALAFWALPRIGATIAARQARIRADLDAARDARREADVAIARLEEAIRNAYARGERTVNEAIDAAKARALAQRKQADARLEERLARAEADIADARARAMTMLVPIAEEVTASLVARVAGRAPNPDALARALGAARPAA